MSERIWHIVKVQSGKRYVSSHEYRYRKEADQQANALRDEMGDAAEFYVLDTLEMLAFMQPEKEPGA